MTLASPDATARPLPPCDAICYPNDMLVASHHRAVMLPPCLVGVEAVSLVSARAFPRHAHDQFGLGVVREGGHASWSGLGPVEAGPDEVIAVSPAEMHDGAPVGGARAWDMLYVAPETVARLAGPEAGRGAKRSGLGVESNGTNPCGPLSGRYVVSATAGVP